MFSSLRRKLTQALPNSGEELECIRTMNSYVAEGQNVLNSLDLDQGFEPVLFQRTKIQNVWKKYVERFRTDVKQKQTDAQIRQDFTGAFCYNLYLAQSGGVGETVRPDSHLIDVEGVGENSSSNQDLDLLAFDCLEHSRSNEAVTRVINCHLAYTKVVEAAFARMSDRLEHDPTQGPYGFAIEPLSRRLVRHGKRRFNGLSHVCDILRALWQSGIEAPGTTGCLGRTVLHHIVEIPEVDYLWPRELSRKKLLEH